MKFDVMIASLTVGFALNWMTWGYSFGRSSKIYLPSDQSRWWFFDRTNQLHPNLFRTVSSLTAFIGIALYGHELQIWIAAAAIFAPAFAIYWLTCHRSYYLDKSDREKHPLDRRISVRNDGLKLDQ